MRIPEKEKQEILEYGAANIVSIIGDYLLLRQSGKVFEACCPFHGEKTPSFTVSPERGTWHCFGTCSEGGDVAKFIMKMDGLNFGEALVKLASRGGIAIPGAGETREEKEKKAIYAALAKAETFFRNSLNSSSEGKNYVDTRMTPAMVESFGIGFAPKNDGKALLAHFTKIGVPTEIAEKAGLIRKDDKEQYRDVFWGGRVMFPIKNKAGYTIGFAGRRIDGISDYKYVNSPETPVYKKRSALYGLDKADLSSGEAFAVEGYLDHMQMWSSAIRNVVAACGTSFSEDHLQVLKRLGVKRVNLMFDGDAAGKKAIIRSIKYAIDAELEVFAYVLPEGVDPDDYFKAGGKLEGIKVVSGLDYLAANDPESMTATMKKLHQAEKLEKAMMHLLTNSSEAASIAASWGSRLTELFSAGNAEKMTALVGKVAPGCTATEIPPMEEAPVPTDEDQAGQEEYSDIEPITAIAQPENCVPACPSCASSNKLELGEPEDSDAFMCLECAAVYNAQGVLHHQ